MAHEFDAGYRIEPFRTLCREYPGADVYPPSAFRFEWGPVFSRGRLDGSARLFVLGQDPAEHEQIARRILVGEAGQRAQGFLARLGFTASYVMINAYLYSVLGGQQQAHIDDPGIVAYRHRWLDALLVGTRVEAVVAFGGLADHAWQTWRQTPAGAQVNVASAHCTHPTAPEGATKGIEPAYSQAIAAMLANWNKALDHLHPHITHPDQPTPVKHYGKHFAASDRPNIPEADLPAGLPDWMRGPAEWAQRGPADPTEKRRGVISVVVPPKARTWPP
jgi:uracil-DNA glycosylase